MVEIPQHELNNLASMDGYEKMLEMDRMCRVYQTDEATIQAALAHLATPQPASPAPPSDPASSDSSFKSIPALASSPSLAHYSD